jgi:uncharacterized membrane protein
MRVETPVAGKHPANELRDQRARAVKTAWVLAVVAVAIFTAFVGSAVMGH